LSEAKISRLFNGVFLNLQSGDVLQAHQHILNDNKGKFFSTIKESDYLKLDLTYVKTMMKIHLQGILKQEETQVELEKERMQHENKVQVELEEKRMQCEKVQVELKNERAQHKKERMQHEKVQVELKNERAQHKKVKSVLNKINLVSLLEPKDSQAFNSKK
jgi:hypothetical protein